MITRAFYSFVKESAMKLGECDFKNKNKSNFSLDRPNALNGDISRVRTGDALVSKHGLPREGYESPLLLDTTAKEDLVSETTSAMRVKCTSFIIVASNPQSRRITKYDVLRIER